MHGRVEQVPLIESTFKSLRVGAVFDFRSIFLSIFYFPLNLCQSTFQRHWKVVHFTDKEEACKWSNTLFTPNPELYKYVKYIRRRNEKFPSPRILLSQAGGPNVAPHLARQNSGAAEGATRFVYMRCKRSCISVWKIFICLCMWLKPCTTAEDIKQQEKRSLFNIEANTEMSTCNGVKSVWEDIMTSVIEKAGGWKFKWFSGPFWEFAEPKTPQAVKQMWLLRWQTKVLCCLKCRWGSRNECHWAATMNSRLHRLLSFCTVCLQNYA